jgi:signal transduction histidine kinase
MSTPLSEKIENFMERHIRSIPAILVGTLLFVGLTVFLATSLPFYRNDFRREEERLEGSVRALNAVLSGVLSRSAVSADLLSRNEKLARLLEDYSAGKGDLDAVSAHLTVLQQSFDGDFVEVVAPDGAVLVSSFPNRSGIVVKDWHLFRGLADNFQPTSFSNVGGTIVGASSGAIVDGGKSLGTLVVGYTLDWWFLASLSKTFSSQLMLLPQGSGGVSTLRTAGGSSYFPSEFHGDSADFRVGQERFIGRVLPLHVTMEQGRGEVVARILVANSLGHFYETLTTMAWNAFLWVLPLLIGGIFLSYRLSNLLLSTTTRVISLSNRLKEMNVNLEGIVRERTQRIRDILDHVQFGFFLVGCDGTIQDGYTRSCEVLLGRDALVGAKLSELVHPEGGDSAAGFGYLFEQVFDSFFPQEVSLAQLPSRFTAHNRILSLEGSVVKNDQGEIRAVLFSIADVTHLERAERLSKENGRMVRILTSRDAFVNFLKDTKNCLAEAYRASENHDSALLLQDLHTIKGNAAMFGLDEVSRLVHALEEKQNLGLSDLNSIEEALRRFLDESAHILNLQWDDLDSVVLSISSQILENIEHAFLVEDVALMRREIAFVLSESRKRRVIDILGPIGDRTEQMALGLGKEIKMEVTGGHMVVPMAYLQPILKNLIHLLRNAVDHGIESPLERGVKSAVGRIVLAFSEDESSWRIRIADDGRGLDVDSIKTKAVARGIISEAQAESMSRSDLERLIFVSGFSTAEAASEISGRGRGTSAALDAVTALHGDILLSSIPKKGTTFSISIPKPPGSI